MVNEVVVAARGGTVTGEGWGRWSTWPWFLLATAAFAADALGKSWAVRTLTGRGTVWIWRPWLALRLLRNPGATLGFASSYPGALTIVAALGVLVLGFLLARRPAGRLVSFGVALMLGGAAGNLASRLAGGSVVDFLRIWAWPGIFNPADVFLRLGALLFVLALAFTARPKPRPGA